MVEQPAVNRRVAGSSPASGAIFSGRIRIRLEVLITRDDDKVVYWVYILQNSEGGFYIGHSEDLPTRLHSHNRTDKLAGKYTRKSGPWRLVWWEEHPTRASAMARERQIKAMKSASWIRHNLLNGRVPTRRD